MGLKRIVEKPDTPAGRRFDEIVLGLILISLVAFSVETVPDLSPMTLEVLDLIELVTVMLFTIEYGLRVAVADHRWRFVTSFFGVVDLVAILPFYLAVGVDLRTVRALRFLRIFRIVKLGRYSRALRRLHRAALIVREELVLFLSVALVLIYLAAVGIYYFEHDAQPEAFASVFHSLWWAIVTLTTVGYGDVYPITAGGRIFTFFILFLGLGIVSVPTGLLASALAKAREEEHQETSGPD